MKKKKRFFLKILPLILLNSQKKFEFFFVCFFFVSEFEAKVGYFLPQKIFQIYVFYVLLIVRAGPEVFKE